MLDRVYGQSLKIQERWVLDRVYGQPLKLYAIVTLTHHSPAQRAAPRSVASR